MEIKKLLYRLAKTEKIILAFLGLILIVTGFQILQKFYIEHTESNYVSGGVYIEGAVGKVSIINPLFIQQGTPADDLTRLIFSGLTKYDTNTGEIVGDLANVKASENGKKYTFVIKENALWHDGEPVTANDVVFTYSDIIKSPVFKGNILNYNDYTGIKVAKLDERTIEFLLEKSDSFFLVKTMVGILPRHLLESEPVEFLETAPFNFAPVGSGRFKYVSQVQLPDHIEYGLEAFEKFYDGPPKINSILYKVFPDFEGLQKKLSGLTAIRNIPSIAVDDILKRDSLNIDRYQLPQYVALFMNNESSQLKEANVRLALQLGTDKDSLIEGINEVKTIDTPLLEIDQSNWIHQYSVTKANGALFETQWQIPNKDEEVEEETDEVAEEVSPTAEVTYINSPNAGKDWTTTKEPITITGTVPANTKTIYIDDYELKKYVPGDAGWSYIAAKKFDSLKDGENVYKIYTEDSSGEKTLIDAITITFGTAETQDEEKLEKQEEENEKAEVLPVRENKKGEKLTLNLITSNKPESYSQVASIIKQQWAKIGVELNVEILEGQAFQERIFARDYDLLLFGQNLGYNLDAYPYWHSSQAKEGGLNLSQFKNFVVDSLLEKARLEDGEDRQGTLEKIQEIIAQEVPAIFLYSPTYFTAFDQDIKHPGFDLLATTSDRLGSIETWYTQVDRKFKDGVNPLTLIIWIIKQF